MPFTNPTRAHHPTSPWQVSGRPLPAILKETPLGGGSQLKRPPSSDGPGPAPKLPRLWPDAQAQGARFVCRKKMLYCSGYSATMRPQAWLPCLGALKDCPPGERARRLAAWIFAPLPVPRRILPLLEEFLRGVETLNLLQVLGRFCPNRAPAMWGVVTTGERGEDPAPAAKDVVEWAEVMSQPDDVASDGEEFRGVGLGGPRSKKRERPHLVEEPSDEAVQAGLAGVLDYASSPDKVVAFLQSAFRSLLPPGLLGSGANLRVVLTALADLVTRGRSEVLSLAHIRAGIKTRAVEWLHPYVPHTRRAETLERLLRFLLAGIAVPIIRQCFYVTEADGTGPQLWYFRKPVWRVIEAFSLRALFPTQYTALDPEAARRELAASRLGSSDIRLLPKRKGGIRILAHLSKPPLRPESGRREAKSVNQVLANAYHVLKFEYKCRPSLAGVGEPCSHGARKLVICGAHACSSSYRGLPTGS
jgi:hypothetical protein